jgi:hypothetical protein
LGAEGLDGHAGEIGGIDAAAEAEENGAAVAEPGLEAVLLPARAVHGGVLRWLLRPSDRMGRH